MRFLSCAEAAPLVQCSGSSCNRRCLAPNAAISPRDCRRRQTYSRRKPEKGVGRVQISVADCIGRNFERGQNMNEKNAVSAEGNKAILLRLFSELRKGNTSALNAVCSPDFAFHSPNFPNWPRGLEGARAIATLGPSLFSDTQSSIDDVFAAEAEWSCAGRFAANTSENQSRDFRTPASVLRWARSQSIGSSMER